jgi:nucleoside-diphosphate-sugar epimerase
MKIFVTGGTGFIGSHFLEAALLAGHDVIALRRPGARPRISLTTEPAWVEAGEGEVQVDWLADRDVFVHLSAAGVDPADSGWEKCFKHNVNDSLSLWLISRRAGLRDFLICGSCFEYGRSGERYDFIPVDAPLEPTGPYHASKAAASMAAIAFAATEDARVKLLRPFHVFGEGEAKNRLWPSLRAAAREGRDFPMTAGGQIRDFVPVEALARKFVEELDFSSLSAGEARVSNIGTGKPTSILEFCTQWWNAFGAKGKLLPGAISYRDQEVMRYVPQVIDPVPQSLTKP